MCCKRMTESMTANVFNDTGFTNGFLYCSLQNYLMSMVTSYFSSLRVFPTVLLREDPLPAPFAGRIRIFVIQNYINHIAPTNAILEEYVNYTRQKPAYTGMRYSRFFLLRYKLLRFAVSILCGFALQRIKVH